MGDESSIDLSRVLGEILQIQRWAGGEAVASHRLFGLLNGFESVIREERNSRISQETQRLVEDILDEVGRGELSPNNMTIKDRLRRDGVTDSDAGKVMKLCFLQGRFKDAIEKVVAAGSTFTHIRGAAAAETQWRGALHYMELVDLTDGAAKPVAVFAPAVPRVGELVEPLKGEVMRVVSVSHLVHRYYDSAGFPMAVMVPHIMLKPDEDEEDGQSNRLPQEPSESEADAR